VVRGAKRFKTERDLEISDKNQWAVCREKGLKVQPPPGGGESEDLYRTKETGDGGGVGRGFLAEQKNGQN